MLKPTLVDRLVPLEAVGDPARRERICVFTIHDGGEVPRRVLGADADTVVNHPEVGKTFVRERDWGANLVAECLVAELGLGSYLRVNLARVLLDYGRFPGVSRNGGDYLLRKSIYPPTADLLSPEVKHRLITHYYDGISARLTRRFADANVTLGIHTYDPVNVSGTERPEVGLVTRSLSYQWHATLPDGVFDRLFPSILCESTSNKSLMFQTVLNLEQGGRDVALNHPYVMPEGSVEIRAQVWFFFRFLHRRFAAAQPETEALPAYRRVWQMLLDVTRRSSDAELLRGYLHRYREAPAGDAALFAAARQAYGHIEAFLGSHEHELVNGYRFSAERPSCIGVEVRKDLLFDIDPDRQQATLRRDAHDNARDIARLIAPAVRDHLEAFFPAVAEPRRATSPGIAPVAV